MYFHTYNRRRSVLRSAAFIVVLFIGLELSLQGTTGYITGFSEKTPEWFPESWTAHRLLILYLGGLLVFLVDLIVSGLVYFKTTSRMYVRRFVFLQLLGILFLTSMYEVAEHIPERWAFTFIVTFSITTYVGLTEKYLKPIEPKRQEDLPNQG